MNAAAPLASIDTARYERDFASLGFAATTPGILELVIANEGLLNAATESKLAAARAKRRPQFD